jgi:transcriptional regulator with AAA-type ATPase domain
MPPMNRTTRALNEIDRAFLQAVSKLAYCNPFLPERIAYEREALGQDFGEAEPVWSMRVDDPDRPNANVTKISNRLNTLGHNLRELLAGGVSLTDEEWELYEVGVLFGLYRKYEEPLHAAIVAELETKSRQGRFDFYSEFLGDWQHYFHLPRSAARVSQDPAHVFASFFQLRRAFHLIFRYIVGTSMAAARLRAAAWQSIFTHDMRRYRTMLYERMGDITTLIIGPSGTGKELVARAIGLSRYIPFDTKRQAFVGNVSSSFHALNLSALPSTLIESELFGHRRGAFTGALEDRRGWLETCEPWGSVFLDEVGDLDPAVQVKLLRVLQTRTFQSLGDNKDKLFHGKIIAATNRDLAAALQKGDFRTDFYYRLCSDVIVTPSFRQQIRESPQVLREMIVFLARSLTGPDAEKVADEVEHWINTHLEPDYPWPGNIRELEQCVRSVLIRGEYHPPRAPTHSAREQFIASMADGVLNAEELLSQYCTLVYSQMGSYEETAKRLKLDWRTVRKKVDSQLLAQLRTKT